MISERSQVGARSGLSDVAHQACRVPQPGTMEAEFAGADGTLVQRRWTEAVVPVKVEQLQPVAAYPSGAWSAMGAGLVVVGPHRAARHARLAGDVHTPAPVDDAGGAGAGGPASSAVAAYWQRSS
ncbi:hypothetical protein ACF1G0_32630 [Streptomyces sp. NPDC013953]|uniref:hypothetical protein n=1 Tax=Streptomyces sp. NPDC013953 TaxID=3364868 RepID=UPI0036F5C182